MRPHGLVLTILACALLFVGCASGAQTDACRQYVQCVDARDVQLSIETDVARFEEDGACWGSPAGEELCNTACENGLVYLAGEDGAPQECKS